MQLPGHLRHVRPPHQRGTPRPGPVGTPRAVLPGEQVRDQAPGRPAPAQHRRQPRVRALGLRGVPAAPRLRPHRPLLPAPRRPPHADRGDRRRDGRARPGGQGPLPRALGGLGGDDPPRPRRPPDHGRPERVLAVDPRHRAGRDAHADGAGDRPGRLLAARTRASCRGASAPPRSSTRATSAATAPASTATTCART